MSEIAKKYPLFKILRAVVKKFFFNEFEIIFFAHFTDENEWKINDDILKTNSNSI